MNYFWQETQKKVDLFDVIFFFQAEDGIRDVERSRGLGDVYKRQAVNKARKSRFRNALKKMNLLIDGKKKDEALKFLPKLNSELMKIAKTGIIKKQNASRNVSRITKKIAAI